MGKMMENQVMKAPLRKLVLMIVMTAMKKRPLNVQRKFMFLKK